MCNSSWVCRLACLKRVENITDGRVIENTLLGAILYWYKARNSAAPASPTTKVVRVLVLEVQLHLARARGAAHHV